MLSFQEQQQAEKRIDEIFEGPLLNHGFIDSQIVRHTQRRTELRASDLIQEIMDVTGVKAVQSITMAVIAGQEEAWALSLDPQTTPRFKPPSQTALTKNGSDKTSLQTIISLQRNGLPVQVDMSSVDKHFRQWQRLSASRKQLSWDDPSAFLPAGQDRQVDLYHSIHHHLPITYGVGEMGLPTPPSPQRKAQAKQLQAYLLFFDQLLANYFAQLAHVGDLFSATVPENTYFSQLINDPALQIEDILQLTSDELQEMTAYSEDGRQNRFLNHLLARFAEKFTDYALVMFENAQHQQVTAEKIIENKEAFLQAYPTLSRTRGTGLNYLPQTEENLSGLEKRLQYKLGLIKPERFIMVEHVLLRPTIEDKKQTVPFLQGDAGMLLTADPYSLHLSFIFPQAAGRFVEPFFRSYIERTIREETPAHLTFSIQWLNPDAMATFAAAYANWLVKLQDRDTIHFQLRDARDRLIDLLEFGNTYPIQDLSVPDEKLTVPYETSAKITIEHSQKQVLYQLHLDGKVATKPDGDNLGDSKTIEAYGNGDTLELETQKITADTTFQIYAVKQNRLELATYLHQTASVKVGLDTGLAASIKVLPLLDDNQLVNPPEMAARVTYYGTQVEVDVRNSQEGVYYQLLYFAGGEEVLISDQELGTANDITIISQQVTEDIDIRIKAIKTFADDRETEEAILDVILPLKVRANPTLSMSLTPNQIIDYNQQATLILHDTQISTAYQLYLRTVPDNDIVHLPMSDTEFIKVSVPDKPVVQIRRPPRASLWELPEEFREISSFQAGTGGDLPFILPALTQESVIVIRAQKQHKATLDPEDSQTIPSSVQLSETMAILVRPNPDHPIRLRTEISGTTTGEVLEVFDGQPGVFYSFKLAPDGTEIEQSAYFHKWNEQEMTAHNKGIDQLTIAVDFVVTQPYPSDIPIDPVETPPLSPNLDIKPIPLDSTLEITAMKAMTRVNTPMTKVAQIAALPDIQLQEPVVDYGSITKILVIASQPGDRYEPYLYGKKMKQARNGNGQDLSFNTLPITEDSQFEVRVTRPGDTNIAVERFVTLEAIVRPNPNLSVTATDDVVDANGTTIILVETSQQDVLYQLMSGTNPIGQPVMGNGQTVHLITEPLTANTTFSVRASKASHPAIFSILKQSVTVSISSN